MKCVATLLAFVLIGGSPVGGFTECAKCSVLRYRTIGVPIRVVAKLSRKAKQRADKARDIEVISTDPEKIGEVTVVTKTPDPPVAACGEPIFPFLSADFNLLRVRSRAPIYDTMLSAVLAVNPDDESAWEDMVVVNRDSLDYRFLYKLTAQILAARNLGNEERVEQLRAIRLRVVKSTQQFDAPLYREIGQAEGRLGQVLAQFLTTKKPTSATVVQMAGSSARQIFCFWLVICSAISAWEKRRLLDPTNSIPADKIIELTQIRDVIEGRETLVQQAGLELLAPLLRLPSMDNGQANFEQARDALQELVSSEEERERLLRRLGCIHCQLQRHAYQAYAPMTAQVAALYDVLLYGAPQLLETEEIFSPPRTDYTSTLVKITEESGYVFEENGMQLFW
mmetsp:Transcript_5172/g.8692  ORF Transcript_5172/g.8692 Transcript_5172/m.8692 type:complete len:395 (+) Transcript_5172:33-1217(+)|eukprot:CAMPEP_0119315408 /NCGR_PEP_ID=MMETSP1333-20130426/35741_1 /TAXON_ID=418940 /ORGANISM="Scyphosphaera apsteinii, Strain RCC1455" /LENGTH=394 /DNA_ID=CAMNT_0007320759 /DNA_START=27 /DNA_END=1211 /DNA_ORIENTATION=-